jgi:small subunit ribosomal protein S16
MSVRIRLMRMGSKRRPFYRFVVTDSRGKRDGGFLDRVGYYNPIVEPHEIEVDEERIFEWLGKGAGLSDGARSLLQKSGTLARWRSRHGQAQVPEEQEVGKEVAEESEEESV